MTVQTARPFTDRLRDLHGPCALTYQQIAAMTGVRSHSWIGDLLRAEDPSDVSPPKTEAHFAGFAAAFGCTPEMVRALIAEEWYGVIGSELSHRVRGAATTIDSLCPDDWQAVQRVLSAMAR